MCVRVYQKSVCKVYRTGLQSSVTGFLMPDQRHFLSLYSYSLVLLLYGVKLLRVKLPRVRRHRVKQHRVKQETVTTNG